MRIDKLARPGMMSFVMQRLCTWYLMRLPLSRLIAYTKPQRLASSDPVQEAEIVKKLERDGFALLPRFVDSKVIARILKHLKGAALSERFAERRSGFNTESVPKNVHVAEYDISDLLKCPDLVALTQHPMLLDVAAGYLGCKPTISSISLWWSFPADGSAQEAENYHRDVDDWRFVKFFLYLTDVDEESGPHRFVRGSHKSGKFLLVRRLADRAVECCFGNNNCLARLGNSGDAFLEDTFGLHKGQPPIRNARLVFQVQYSISPIAVYDYHAHPLVVKPPTFDAYSARLYVTNSQP